MALSLEVFVHKIIILLFLVCLQACVSSTESAKYDLDAGNAAQQSEDVNKPTPGIHADNENQMENNIGLLGTLLGVFF